MQLNSTIQLLFLLCPGYVRQMLFSVILSPSGNAKNLPKYSRPSDIVATTLLAVKNFAIWVLWRNVRASGEHSNLLFQFPS